MPGSLTSLGAIPLGLTPPELETSGLEPLEDLLEAREAGEEWDLAFSRFLDAVSLQRPPSWPPAEGRQNWLWLTDLDRVDCAIDLGSPFGEAAAELESEAPRVCYVGRPSLHGRIVTHRLGSGAGSTEMVFPSQLGELAPDSADCVTFIASSGWDARLPVCISDAGQIAEAVHRLLRPGGWAGLFLPNPFSYHRLRDGSMTVRTFRMERELLVSIQRRFHAGAFRGLRAYDVIPDLGTPATLLPWGQEASLAFDPRLSTSNTLHRWIRTELRPFNFRAILLLVKK